MLCTAYVCVCKGFNIATLMIYERALMRHRLYKRFTSSRIGNTTCVRMQLYAKLIKNLERQSILSSKKTTPQEYILEKYCFPL